MDYEETEDQNIKRKETAAQKQKRSRIAFESILAREDGRVVLAEILSWTGFEAENFSLGEAGARNEGMRSIGLRLLRTCREANKENSIKLYQEIING